MTTFMKSSFGIALLSFVLPCSCFATAFSSDASYEVCFTPQQHCLSFLSHILDQAKQQIRIQAYSFTSRPIVHALMAAKGRGVDIQVLADKSQVQSDYSSIAYLQRQGVQVAIDYLPAIAHSKVIIIDQSIVVTGSYNFTNAAEFKNAENMLIIHDVGLAKSYLKNWQWRAKNSTPLASYKGGQDAYDRMVWMDMKHLIHDLMKWIRLLFKWHAQ